MAIQRLGSSLMAKSQSGSRLRSAEEDRQTGALQRGADSAQIGSPVRGSVDEPINKLEPQGTQKVVSVQPSITPTEKSVVSRVGIAPSLGAASRINSPSSGGGKASNPGGGATPASRTAFQPAKTTSSAGGAARPAASYAPGGGGVLGLQTNSQGSPVRVQNPTSVGNKGFLSGVPSAIMSLGGGRVAAADFASDVQKEGRNLGQAVALTIGNATGNKTLQKIGTSAKITQSGVGSITKPLATIKAAPTIAKKTVDVVKAAPAALRSVAQKASNTVQNVIRSLTRKK